MSTAYLVVTLDARVSPPRVVGCGIFSEPAGSLTVDHSGRYCYLDGPVARAESYEGAVKLLRQTIGMFREYAWAIRWLDSGGPSIPGE